MYCGMEGLSETIQASGLFLTTHPHLQGRLKCRTGVWVGERKIGAVGVKLSHGISSHGTALNVSLDLDWYRHIVACGNADRASTSMAEVLGAAPPMHAVAKQYADAFSTRFGYTAVEVVHSVQSMITELGISQVELEGAGVLDGTSTSDGTAQDHRPALQLPEKPGQRDAATRCIV